MELAPTITVEIRFLPEAEGGRRHMPDLASGSYAPQLVVPTRVEGAPEQYLGVRFMAGPSEAKLGETIRCSLALVYHPQVNYAALQVGAEFEVREGPKVVGRGTVVSERLSESIAE